MVYLAGVFEETDTCCREHDHCKDTIASFSFDHGVFNTNIFTLSHCDCDNRYASFHSSVAFKFNMIKASVQLLALPRAREAKLLYHISVISNSGSAIVSWELIVPCPTLWATATSTCWRCAALSSRIGCSAQGEHGGAGMYQFHLSDAIHIYLPIGFTINAANTLFWWDSPKQG